jgi:hypothetical protein
MIIDERTIQIRKAAIAAAYGESEPCPEPATPTAGESLYLRAREIFPVSQCRGWELIEAGDRLTGLP